jgi:hypothetical protein
MENNPELIKSLLEIQKSLIDQRKNLKKTILDLQKQIDNLNQDTYIINWLNLFGDEVFKTDKKMETALIVWAQSHIKVEDITIINGRYDSKYFTVYVYTCGYLENKLLYSHYEGGHCFIDGYGTPTTVEKFYPKDITTIKQFRDAFLKLYKAREKEGDDLEDVDDRDDDLIQFVITYGFYRMSQHGFDDDHEPGRKGDFSRLDY